jgi:hypothetical protein
LGGQAKETGVERPLEDLLEWLRLAGTALKRKMPAWHSVWDRWVMQVTSSNRFRYLEFLQQNLKGHHSLTALWGNRYDEPTYQTKKSAENS